MPFVWGYIRVSHDDSAKSGLSPQDQQKKIQEWVEREMRPGGILAGHRWGQGGYERWPMFDERGQTIIVNRRHVIHEANRTDGLFVELGESAYMNDFLTRPVGVRLNAAIKPGDCVVFAYFDRCFRSTRDHAYTVDVWERRGIKNLIFLDALGVDRDSPFGGLQLTLMSAFSEVQSKLLSSKMKGVSQRLQDNGRCQSRQRARLGFKPDGKGGYEPCPEQMHILHMIVDHIDNKKVGRHKTSTAIKFWVVVNERQKPNPAPAEAILAKAAFWTPERVNQGYKVAHQIGIGQGPPNETLMRSANRGCDKKKRRMAIQDPFMQ